MTPAWDDVLSQKGNTALLGVWRILSSWAPQEELVSSNGGKVQKTLKEKNTPLNKDKTHYTLHLFKKKNLLTSWFINKGAIKYHIIKGMGMKTEYVLIKRQCYGIYLLKKKNQNPNFLSSLLLIGMLRTNAGLLLKVRKLLFWAKKLEFVPIFLRKGVTFCEQAQQREQKNL